MSANRHLQRKSFGARTVLAIPNRGMVGCEGLGTGASSRPILRSLCAPDPVPSAHRPRVRLMPNRDLVTPPDPLRAGRGRAGLRALVGLVAVGGLFSPPPVVEAQSLPSFSQFREGSRNAPIRAGFPEHTVGFTFCRLQYQSVRFEQSGYGWSTDYPRGDLHLTLRLSELTPTPISFWEDGEPGLAVVRPTDPDLFRCPFLFASDVGTAGFTELDAERLRDYFLKGGFLWADDFWGSAAWSHWSDQMGRILPEYEIIDLPLDHPLFSIVYTVEEVPQIAHIGFWRSNGGRTQERGSDSPHANLRAILDKHGRILVLMSHNTDIADGWEREADNDEFFALFSPAAYAVGVNVLVWMMTH
jgi:hypothetical protein